MVLALAGLYLLWPSGPRRVDLGGRLAYALQANVFAALPLLVSIMAVGNNRFLTDAIDPTLQKEDAATRINTRVVDNTLQQFVLFFAATTALSVSLAEPHLTIIPAAAIVFVAARIAFWIGYRIHPLYRAPGMAATGFLNLGLLAAALWKAVV
jgi:amino acid permease